ncbi:MAG: hypothetical protein K0S61_227 [Anaerocolumna sp.]|jgi:hypothetical protein|nr:hypothetical protein [Anaerocolumna sp.]
MCLACYKDTRCMPFIAKSINNLAGKCIANFVEKKSRHSRLCNLIFQISINNFNHINNEIVNKLFRGFGG